VRCPARKAAGAAAKQIAVARDHGEVRARADDGKKGDGRDGQQFGEWSHCCGISVSFCCVSRVFDGTTYGIFIRRNGYGKRYILAIFRDKN
jgi:hypothetical protein